MNAGLSVARSRVMKHEPGGHGTAGGSFDERRIDQESRVQETSSERHMCETYAQRVRFKRTRRLGQGVRNIENRESVRSVASARG